MKLSTIREANTIEELKPAMKYLLDNMQAMTFGDFIAVRNTIEQAGKKLGYTFQQLNEIAANLQGGN